jgi:hypothetical protein
LRNTLTLVGGRALPARAVEPPAPWVELTEAQRAWRREARTAPDPRAALTRPEDFAAAP